MFFFLRFKSHMMFIWKAEIAKKMIVGKKKH